VQATKATIQENEAMSGELRYTAKRAEKLLLQAEKLTAENAALKRELEISKTVCITSCHPLHSTSKIRLIRCASSCRSAAGADVVTGAAATP
jgi:hypothetical protein